MNNEKAIRNVRGLLTKHESHVVENFEERPNGPLL
jgi:hypothetical protein